MGSARRTRPVPGGRGDRVGGAVRGAPGGRIANQGVRDRKHSTNVLGARPRPALVRQYLSAPGAPGPHRPRLPACPQVNDTVPLSSALAAIRATLWKLFIALVTRRFAFLSWVVSAARASRICALSRCRLNARGTMSPIQTELAANSTAQGLGDQAIGDVIALDCFGRAGLCGGLRAIMDDPLATASRGSRHHPALPPRSARMGTISLPSSLPSPPGGWPLRQASLL